MGTKVKWSCRHGRNKVLFYNLYNQGETLNSQSSINTKVFYRQCSRTFISRTFSAIAYGDFFSTARTEEKVYEW